MLHLYDCNKRYIGLDKVQSWLPWWLSGKKSTCQWRRSGFDPWIRKILWRRKWKPTPVFLPGKSHGQKSLRGYSPWGCKTVRHVLATKQQQHVVINWTDINIFISDLENQFSSVAQLCLTLCGTMDHSTPGLPVHHQLLEFTQNSRPLSQWYHPTISSSSSPSPSAFNLSQHQGIFKWVSSSHQVAKVLEFQLQHQSFQWTLRTDFLAVQGTLKSLLQHHSSKVSILWCSAFFTVQLSHPYMTVGKTIALLAK